MGKPLQVREGGDQHFPSPDHAIGTVSRSIEGKPDQLPVIQTVIHHARDNVRVVMLDSNTGNG